MSSIEPPASLPPREKHTKALAAVVVVLAFVAGLAAGIAGDRLFMFRHHLFSSRTALELAASRMLDRLDHELGLSPQQREQVRQIMDRRRERINAIWSSVRPQVRQELDEANREIERVLTPDQRAKFEKIKMGLAARRHERR